MRSFDAFDDNESRKLLTEDPSTRDIARFSIAIGGIVQGVGFRPFVYNLAKKHSLTGFVRNAGGLVEIEVQGAIDRLELFIESLRLSAPPLSLIDSLQIEPIAVLALQEPGFQIKVSRTTKNEPRSVAPDSGTCQDCLNELFDPADRRFRYPFVNCTNCGPRFTIMQSLPYDRNATTMACFKMCDLCQKEYDDPGNRRFHAQPNACSQCGPSLTFVDKQGGSIEDSETALRMATQSLCSGYVIAIKGLGGFHLICDATSDEAVRRLRSLKRRERKPLALMMSDVAMAEKFCWISDEEKSCLTDLKRPIVLLRKKSRSNLAEGIAPGINQLGVMLPYTPLHHLLLHETDRPLVATSGNRTDEPIAIDNQEALLRLADIADGFLLHDRSIESRYDDSVIRPYDGVVLLLRRSRGYAPQPLPLPFKAKIPVLACGGHLKNTFCLLKDDKAFVSQHIGDLDNEDTLQHFDEVLERFKHLFSISPELIAHDMHPDYLSTAIAKRLSSELNVEPIAIQHHHAHIVSCMAEHGLKQPVIGVAFDGLGYGTDGTAWGGEFFVCTLKSFERKAYFQPVAMPGGTAAMKQPWRMAISLLASATGSDRAALESFEEHLSWPPKFRPLAK